MKSRISPVFNTGYVAVFYIVLLFSSAFSEPLRTRRQSSQQYLIDTLVVVDDVMFSRFQQWMIDSSAGQGIVTSSDVNTKLKEYVSLVFHQANDRLATLNQSLGYSIGLQIVDIYINYNILDNRIRTQDGDIPSDKALDIFQNWIHSKGYGTMYDHAVLLTGYNLENESSTTGAVVKGRAYTGQLCDTAGYSTSVVQDNGGFQSVFYLVHEVAHSLGASHDGISQNCPDDLYIMSPNMAVRSTQENIDHPWYFSACSVSAINSFVNRITSSSTLASSIQPNCLGSAKTPIPEFTATADSASGLLYPADVQCQMIYGNQSRVCLGGSFTNLDQICTSMYCLHPKPLDQRSQCFEYSAAEGTSCGDKKWCKLGRCVTSDKAPSIDTTCPNGDSLDKINGQECSVAIRNTPLLCYNENIRTQKCCQSCENVRKSSEVCPYGDKILGCAKMSCNTRAAPIYADRCCGTCSNDVSYLCADVSSIDSVTCPERVTMDGRQGCYNTTVASSCCQTCSTYRTSIKAAPIYADRCCGTCSNDVSYLCADVSSIDGVTCPERVTMDGRQGCYNTTVASSCCQTCSTYRTSIKGCDYGDYYLGDTCLDCSREDFACCSSCNTEAVIQWTSNNTGAIIQWTSVPISMFIILWRAGVIFLETAF